METFLRLEGANTAVLMGSLILRETLPACCGGWPANSLPFEKDHQQSSHITKARSFPFHGGVAMLVLGRKLGEKVHIGNHITITVVAIQGNRVRLAIDAPDQVRIMRAELLDRLDDPDLGEKPADQSGTGKAIRGLFSRCPLLAVQVAVLVLGRERLGYQMSCAPGVLPVAANRHPALAMRVVVTTWFEHLVLPYSSLGKGVL
jgi:carbon storage regulator